MTPEEPTVRGGRAWLEKRKAAHAEWDGACRCCAFSWPCPVVLLIAALEEALALEHKHCGLEFCEAEDEVLAKLSPPQDVRKTESSGETK